MKDQIPLKAWLMLLLLAFIWGSSFILIKRAVVGLSSLHVASLRVLIASTCFLPFALLKINKIPFKKFKHFFIAGSVGNLIPSFMFAFAMPHIESTIPGILNALVPVFTLVTALLIWKQKFSSYKIVGVLIGLIGCLILVIFKGNDFHINVNYYALLVVIATFSYGLNTNILKAFFQDMKPLDVATFSLLSVSPIAAIVFFGTGGWDAVWSSEAATISAGYTVVLAMFSSAFALVVFMKLIQITSALFAASVTYLIPIIALFWGFLDNESIGVVQFVGTGVILIGVFLSKKS